MFSQSYEDVWSFCSLKRLKSSLDSGATLVSFYDEFMIFVAESANEVLFKRLEFFVLVKKLLSKTTEFQLQSIIKYNGF